MWWVIVDRSTSGYRETVGRLSEAIERRGLTVFGNPRAGTPLMQSDPRTDASIMTR
jgi:uncharacterized protein (DUF302 family)